MRRPGLALAVFGLAVIPLAVLSSLGCNTGVVTHEQQEAKRKALENLVPPGERMVRPEHHG